MIDHDNYHSFARFNLIDIAQNHSNIINVALTSLPGANCHDQCDGDAIRKEYGIDGSSAPREGGYVFKYAFDVDGNSFSGRYLGLLKSGSLVFKVRFESRVSLESLLMHPTLKSTVFEEYFNDWLRPYEHYIPILPDLSDLVEKVQWAIDHDDEARRIQEAGLQFTERVLTEAQNDCYFFAVLLEYARLQRMAEGKGRGVL